MLKSDSLTLEQKIGQLMVIGFDGTDVNPELRQMIAEYHIGGVVLFARNIGSPRQVAALTNELQQIAIENCNPGLFVAIDQEGGRVARLTEERGFTEFPSAMAIGATADPQNAYRMASAMAAELRAVGINTDFAPDLDVNNNPANPVIGTRSFGSNPNKVAAFGTAFTRGLQENGILAFGKHFPGHGDTAIDSHFALPSVPHDRARLDQIELLPFKAAIAQGITGIMSAHVTFPAIDPTPGMPATLSSLVLTGLLRDELRFEGLIATDSLEMGALSTNGYPPPIGAALAFAAGADLLLFNRDHPMHKEVFANLLQAIQEGRVSQERLDTSVHRILEVKSKFNILRPTLITNPAQADRLTAVTEYRDLASQLAGKAITLLKDDASLLPLKTGEPLLVIETTAAKGIGNLLGTTSFEISNDPDEDAIHAAMEKARGGCKVIVTTVDASFHPGQIQLVNQLLTINPKVIIISVRTPYDIGVLSKVPAALAAYGNNAPSLRAIADVLMGKLKPSGVLPVTLS